MKFKTGWTYQTGDVRFYGQVTVKCNTKVSTRVRNGNSCTAYSHRVWEGERDLEFLPQNIIIASVLSWLSIVIQVLTPSIHFRMERMRSRIWWEAANFLSWLVIGVWMVKDWVFFTDSGRRSCVKNKEYRPKDWFLWNIKWDGSCLRGVAVDTDRLGAFCKVWWKQV